MKFLYLFVLILLLGCNTSKNTVKGEIYQTKKIDIDTVITINNPIDFIVIESGFNDSIFYNDSIIEFSSVENYQTGKREYIIKPVKKTIDIPLKIASTVTEQIKFKEINIVKESLKAKIIYWIVIILFILFILEYIYRKVKLRKPF